MIKGSEQSLTDSIIRFTIYVVCSFVSIIILLGWTVIKRFLKKKQGDSIIFGTTPIINNKYWSNALKEIGFASETLMSGFYPINNKNDFDKYFDDVIPGIFRIDPINKVAHLFFVWFYIINNARILVTSFDGVIYKKVFWKMEMLLLSLNFIKVIVFPYGSDSYMYSKVQDKSLQNALLLSYPDKGKREKEIEDRVRYWSKYADIVITGIMSGDGFPRWDVCIPQFIIIDTKEWVPKRIYSEYDGTNGVVKVLHTPNHRGFKGTEFLISAIDELMEEGLKVELVLLEKVSNIKVKEVMHEVDILAEQFIFGYGLNAIEGMASGLPVLSNLEHDIMNLFRRYSFLNECPIVSTTPETLKKNLRLLITNPELRIRLGQLGRKYVEKYHSNRTFQYLFKSIVAKLDGKDIDLMNLFNPRKADYVKSNIIKTPLINNKMLDCIS